MPVIKARFIRSADYADYRRLKTNQESQKASDQDKSGSQETRNCRAAAPPAKRNISKRGACPTNQVRLHPFTTGSQNPRKGSRTILIPGFLVSRFPFPGFEQSAQSVG